MGDDALNADPAEVVETFTTVAATDPVAVAAAGYAGDRPPEQVITNDKTPRTQPVNTIEQ